MKKATRIKIDELVRAIVKRNLRKDDISINNFINFVMSICKDDKITFHKLTLQKYESYILSKVSDYWYFNDKEEVVVKEEPCESVVELKVEGLEIEYILVKLKSGKELKYVLSEPTVDIKKEQIKEVEIWRPKSGIWNGLFRYDEVGLPTMINKGRYRGCDINDGVSLEKHFGTALEFYGWILDCLRPSNINKVERTRDEKELDMNIKTLLNLKDKIEGSPVFQKFPSAFDRKRKVKGL